MSNMCKQKIFFQKVSQLQCGVPCNKYSASRSVQNLAYVPSGDYQMLPLA